MRLLSLELRGFRGFAKAETFDLDADAVVLVGANGSGKTSLLDGILWALSGCVPRLGEGADVVLSKFSPTGDARVSSSRTRTPRPRCLYPSATTRMLIRYRYRRAVSCC